MIYLGGLVLCAISAVTLTPQDALRCKGAKTTTTTKKFDLTQDGELQRRLQLQVYMRFENQINQIYMTFCCFLSVLLPVAF